MLAVEQLLRIAIQLYRGTRVNVKTFVASSLVVSAINAHMIAGFVGVPLFKFGATALPGAGPYFAELAELPPAFALSFGVGIVLSLTDPAGRARLAEAGVDAEIDAAGR